MVRRLISIACIGLLAAAFGCSGGSDEDSAEAEYRQAIPSEQMLLNSAEEVFAGADAGRVMGRTAAAGPVAGDPAMIPSFAVPVAAEINTAVGNVIAAMQNVLTLPHNYFNPELRVMVWGPYENTTVGEEGQWLLLIYKADPVDGEDWEYAYALYRTSDDFDLVAGGGVFAPVIFGFSAPHQVPDPWGLTLWDLYANANIGSTLGDQALHETGRFAAIYSQQSPAAGILFTAILAGIVNDTMENPAEYLYGRFQASAPSEPFQLDFFQFTAAGEITDDGDPGTPPLDENLDVRMAYVNNGPGRASFTVDGGDYDTDYAEVNECWDAAFGLTYLDWYDSGTGGDPVVILNTGLCAIPDQMWDGLPTLDHPDLYQIRADMADLLDFGIPDQASFIIGEIRAYHGVLEL